eukprot:31836_1
MPTIRVVVRFRPINSREKTTASENNWSGKEICPIYVDDKHLQEYDETSDSKRIGKQVRLSSKSFAFDEILVWVSQQTAFERIGLPVVTDALNGINGTIFAYGQTGSGKTFSMFGPEPLTENNANLLGIIPRCCAQIFANLSTNEKIKGYRIDVSFFEIYIHNKIRDLLHPAKKGDPALKVRDGLKGVFIENLKPETATNLQEILALIALANSHRTVSSTKMNATSSRSHSVMRVQIRIEMKDGSRCKSQINFGDLAGSEKVNKTGATGQTLKEAMAINQSLTLLGNVIAALAKIGSGKKGKGSMVPFRDSALTHVLKDSLSGNCKTTLVTAASPHKFNLIETVSTFRFASRCKLVKTKAEKNVVLSPSQMRKMIEKLKIEVIGLKQKLLKGGGNGGNNDDDSVTGIGVKILWPSDFQPWANDKKVFSTLEKQINSQIKCVLKKTYQDEKDINTIPYVVCLSAPGTKREVTVKFHCDENDSGEYNRNNCIDICNKLAETISKIDNNKLKPALRNYDICESFSQPSIGELKEIISSQKLQINLINEQLENVKKDKINTFEKQLNILNSCNKQYNEFNSNSNRMLYGGIIERNNRKQMIVNDANSWIKNAKRVQTQTESVLETVKDTFMVQFEHYKSFIDDFGNIRDKPKRKRSLSPSTKNSDDEIIILNNPKKKLKLNKKKKKQMLHMTGGIQYRDMKIGSGELIQNGEKVNVFYVGQTDDKQVFDKSISGNGFEFTFGSGDVIKGWDIGLKGMRVGGKRKLVIPPKLAYGANGSPPSIPGNATLTFTIEVKGVN